MKIKQHFLTFVLMLMASAIASALTIMATKYQEIEAENVLVNGPSGDPLVRFGMMKDGGGALDIFDAAGVKRIRIASGGELAGLWFLNDDGSPRIGIGDFNSVVGLYAYDDNNTPRAFVGVLDETAAVSLLDGNGTQRIALLAERSGFETLAFSNAEEEVSLKIGLGNADMPYMMLTHQQTERWTTYLRQDGRPDSSFFDGSGVPRIILSMDEKGLPAIVELDEDKAAIQEVFGKLSLIKDSQR